jgi:hypothetical protein
MAFKTKQHSVCPYNLKHYIKADEFYVKNALGFHQNCRQALYYTLCQCNDSNKYFFLEGLL